MLVFPEHLPRRDDLFRTGRDVLPDIRGVPTLHKRELPASIHWSHLQIRGRTPTPNPPNVCMSICQFLDCEGCCPDRNVQLEHAWGLPKILQILPHLSSVIHNACHFVLLPEAPAATLCPLIPKLNDSLCFLSLSWLAL